MRDESTHSTPSPVATLPPSHQPHPLGAARRGMFYAREVWDPWLIVSQMVALQGCFYLVVSAWLLLFSAVLGAPAELASLFEPHALCVHYALGWPPILAQLLAVPFVALLASRVVERARKCLDFGASLVGWHAAACVAFSGEAPANWEWWAVNAATLVGVVVLGELLCMRREMVDIPLADAVLSSPTAKKGVV